MSKKSYFNWYAYIIAFLLFAALGIFPLLIIADDTLYQEYLTSDFLIWYTLYWIGITVIFTLLTSFQKYITFDKPMRQMSEATEKVARGDFSVQLETKHKKHKDYIDIMFSDFNKMVKELNSIETLKNDFIADVSHEIKTPLAIIQNYITALQQDNLSEEKKEEYIQVIFNSSQKLTLLVSNILKLNKLENQQILANMEEYNLSRQLSDCILKFEAFLEEKNIEIDVDMEEKVLLNADETMVELIWNNLLSNALKFSFQGGKISITLSTRKEDIIVTIQDNGIGMNEETQKHIFDKFYQGDSSRSKDGNGLGMALVKKVVELLNGEIYVESEIGKGTKFTVILPNKI